MGQTLYKKEALAFTPDRGSCESVWICNCEAVKPTPDRRVGKAGDQLGSNTRSTPGSRDCAFSVPDAALFATKPCDCHDWPLLAQCS